MTWMGADNEVRIHQQVPARDAQFILGHSRLAVTLEICTHENREAQREAPGRLSDALGGAIEL